jgi:hypothetical protein
VDFIYLQQHPGTPMEKLPETLSWGIEELNTIVHESNNTGHPISPEALEMVRLMEQEASRYRHP